MKKAQKNSITTKAVKEVLLVSIILVSSLKANCNMKARQKPSSYNPMQDKTSGKLL